ncbi:MULTISPECIES: hypothetical protein [Pseudonocardiaceae]|uniref:Uncharacterized protein n=1 Tax=Saccharopolyspora endophytica TaxID=543886 RepID=A0ABS5DHP2_9PSEU|nr:MULTISPECIES: hypothetical protein [Pseudonocardiaceae]MBQ0925796.1 hypothetical protein [Saccharopolyspora endophytica]
MAGSEAALTDLSTLDDALDHCHRYHATRAEPLRELGHSGQAQAAERRALELTAHPIDQSLLRQRISTASYPPSLV